MNIPPDKRFWRNKPYHPPKRLFSAEELNRIFSSCGTSSRHSTCLTCGGEEDEEHRLNWHLCSNPHVLCTKAHQDGLSCAHMEMSYSWYFTPDFFAEHVGVRMECWQPLFRGQYETVRDKRLGRHHGSRGRQHSRNDGANKGSQSQDSARAKHDKEPSFEDFMARFDQYKAFVKRKRSPSLSPTRSPAKRTKGRCYNCNEQGHIAKNCPNVVCLRCNKQGHETEDCKIQPKPKCGNCGNTNHSTTYCNKPPKLEKSNTSSTQPTPVEIRRQILASDKVKDAEARRLGIHSQTTPENLQKKNQELTKEVADLKLRNIQLENRISEVMVELQGLKQQLPANKEQHQAVKETSSWKAQALSKTLPFSSLRGERLHQKLWHRGPTAREASRRVRP